MKYKLIVEYPGSPELGTVVESQSISKSYFYMIVNKKLCVPNYHVENNPDYWEKVNNDLWWVVWEEDYIQDDNIYFKAWTINEIECIPKLWDDDRRYFKTKEEAEYFILRNKPCLSYNDIAGYLGSGQRDVILNLIEKK